MSTATGKPGSRSAATRPSRTASVAPAQVGRERAPRRRRRPVRARPRSGRVPRAPARHPRPPCGPEPATRGHRLRRRRVAPGERAPPGQQPVPGQVDRDHGEVVGVRPRGRSRRTAAPSSTSIVAGRPMRFSVRPVSLTRRRSISSATRLDTVALLSPVDAAMSAREQGAFARTKRSTTARLVARTSREVRRLGSAVDADQARPALARAAVPMPHGHDRHLWAARHRPDGWLFSAVTVD